MAPAIPQTSVSGRELPVEAGSDFFIRQPAKLTRTAEFGQNRTVAVADIGTVGHVTCLPDGELF